MVVSCRIKISVVMHALTIAIEVMDGNVGVEITWQTVLPLPL